LVFQAAAECSASRGHAKRAERAELASSGSLTSLPDKVCGSPPGEGFGPGTGPVPGAGGGGGKPAVAGC